MKKILTLLLPVLLFACTEGAKKEAESTSPQNFAVVWHWKTDNPALIDDNILNQNKQLTEYWKKGIIENAYFEADPKAERLADYPGISFFIKANSMGKARELLDNMIFVKNNISEYSLHAVGPKWLGRNEEVINAKGTANSWVSVWSTRVDHNSKMSMEEVSENARAQSDLILELYNKGIIENVYFDIEGTQEQNEVTDFVMFVNAETETEARQILDNLPFSKKNIAHYQLFSVGVFWMGEYTNSEN